MSDEELLCNFKKCRKVLTDTAYITRCSHAFCEDDGIKEIESQHFEKKCPACQSPLVKNYDLVKVTLNPNDQFKSMVLAGLRPEIVMDIATRAIMFWNYQQHQEQLYQTMVTKSIKEYMSQIKTDSDAEVGQLKSEIQNLKRKQEDIVKQLEKQTLKSNELSEKVAYKTREIQKWQMMYECLKRKQLSTALLQSDPNNLTYDNPKALNVGPQTMDELLINRPKTSNTEHKSPTDYYMHKKSSLRKDPEPNGGFIFQPRAFNTYMSPKIFLQKGENHRF